MSAPSSVLPRKSDGLFSIRILAISAAQLAREPMPFERLHLLQVQQFSSAVSVILSVIGLERLSSPVQADHRNCLSLFIVVVLRRVGRIHDTIIAERRKGGVRKNTKIKEPSTKQFRNLIFKFNLSQNLVF